MAGFGCGRNTSGPTSLTAVAPIVRLINTRVELPSSPMSGVICCSTLLKISPRTPLGASCGAAGCWSPFSLTVNSEKIAGWLFLLTLLPLAIGLALRAQYEKVAARVKPVFDWVSSITLVPMVFLLAAANIGKILHLFGHPRRPRWISLDSAGLRHRLDARGTWHRHATGIGPWYRAAQHRRRTRGGDRKLQRSERGHHGNSCYDSRVADANATMSRASQFRPQAVP